MNELPIATPREINLLKVQHGIMWNCKLDVYLTKDDKNTIIITCEKHQVAICATIPYRQFCIQPLECAGRSSCPRDYACSE